MVCVEEGRFRESAAERGGWLEGVWGVEQATEAIVPLNLRTYFVNRVRTFAGLFGTYQIRYVEENCMFVLKLLPEYMFGRLIHDPR